MSALTLVMMGTGDFAEPTFRALYATPHRVAALVTQPDPTGPGRHTSHRNLLKERAQERGTPLHQPLDVNSPQSLEVLSGFGPDILVVAAYGQILSPGLLEIPRLATINVHASLLPRYRGASPIVHAILNGDTETGVSIIRVLPRLDAGPILAVARTPIGANETAGELEARLAALAVPLIAPVLDQIAAGTAQGVPQVEGQVTRAPKLKKEKGLIDWSQSARQIDCHIRAMQPWPNAFTFVHADGRPVQRVLVLGVRPDSAPAGSATRPGMVVRADKAGLWVECGSGPIEIVRLQPQGKRPMAAADFLRGNPLSPGDRLGPETI